LLPATMKFSLVISALASAASAEYYLNGELFRRHVVREIVQIRQASGPASGSVTASGTISAPPASGSGTGTVLNPCATVISSLATLLTDLPQPGSALSSYLVTAVTTLTDPCNLNIPASISSDFYVYESSVVSFFSSHSSQILSAVSACPTLTSLVVNPTCSTKTSGGASGGSGGATATATGTATATKTSSPSNVSSAGANMGPRETGIAAALIAAAGAIGAAVVAL
jgi:hypothetical protein